MSGDVLITGSTGFIGGWIAEVMHLEGSFAPIGGVRQWSRGARIARFRIPMRHCDVLDTPSLLDAMAGCRYVVHAAVGDDETTIQGTRNVVRAAEKSDVERVVHLSSVAVYGSSAGVYHEDSFPDETLTQYARRKARAEEEVRCSSVPWVILRPTIVYGPYSDQWTTNFALRLAARTVGEMGLAGQGVCNLVYVTDVVQAVAAALTTRDAEGGVFNVNGPDDLDWNTYFRMFSYALGLGEPPTINVRRLRARSAAARPVRAVGNALVKRNRELLVRLSMASALLDRKMRSTEGALRLTPTREQLDLYSRIARFPADAAAAQLDYAAVVDAPTGIDLAARWVRHHGLIGGLV